MGTAAPVRASGSDRAPGQHRIIARSSKHILPTKGSGCGPGSRLATLQAFIDQGGHIEIGRLAPFECAATASDEHTMHVALQRRRSESLPALLARLDAALRHCFENESFIDEINAP